MIVYLFIHHIHYMFRPVIAATIGRCYNYTQGAELGYFTDFPFIFLYVLIEMSLTRLYKCGKHNPVLQGDTKNWNF
jgi:hypothetical protein